jgi:hypothetical protein
VVEAVCVDIEVVPRLELILRSLCGLLMADYLSLMVVVMKNDFVHEDNERGYWSSWVS